MPAYVAIGFINENGQAIAHHQVPEGALVCIEIPDGLPSLRKITLAYAHEVPSDVFAELIKRAEKDEASANLAGLVRERRKMKTILKFLRDVQMEKVAANIAAFAEEQDGGNPIRSGPEEWED